MALIRVSVGRIVTSNLPEDKLEILKLGVGVTIVVNSEVNQAIGVLHSALPDSAIDLKRTAESPGYFVDTGIPLLLSTFLNKFELSKQSIRVRLIGGGAILNSNSTFDIGLRNVEAVRKALALLKLTVNDEDVGGNLNRSLTVDTNTGLITISAPGRGKWEL